MKYIYVNPYQDEDVYSVAYAYLLLGFLILDPLIFDTLILDVSAFTLEACPVDGKSVCIILL